MQERIFEFPNAVVRVHGEVDLERVKKATVKFLTAVETERRKETTKQMKTR